MAMNSDVKASLVSQIEAGDLFLSGGNKTQVLGLPFMKNLTTAKSNLPVKDKREISEAAYLGLHMKMGGAFWQRNGQYNDQYKGPHKDP
jgi:hypothetical protein